MSTGSLLYPIGYIFLDDNGAPVASGRLYAYRTGTTTAQNMYSDSTLDTATANPIVLNSAGRCTTAIYGDPSSGYDYRLKLATSADVQVWQYDDVVVDGADTATYSEGSFTGTLTGMTASTTGTVDYRIVANSAGTGKLCTLYLASTLTGTSNTTALTMTGLPAACTPVGAVRLGTVIVDSGNNNDAMLTISAAATTITFYTDANLDAAGFTASGTKGLGGGWTVTYLL